MGLWRLFMLLWTIQDYSAYEMMLETGVLAADEEHYFVSMIFETLMTGWLIK